MKMFQVRKSKIEEAVWLMESKMISFLDAETDLTQNRMDKVCGQGVILKQNKKKA